MKVRLKLVKGYITVGYHRRWCNV